MIERMNQSYNFSKGKNDTLNMTLCQVYGRQEAIPEVETSQPDTVELIQFIKVHGGSGISWIDITEVTSIQSCCKTTKSQVLREKAYNAKLEEIQKQLRGLQRISHVFLGKIDPDA